MIERREMNNPYEMEKLESQYNNIAYHLTKKYRESYGCVDCPKFADCEEVGKAHEGQMIGDCPDFAVDEDMVEREAMMS